MTSLNVSISEAAHRNLLEISAREGQPLGAVLDRAIELYRRQKFLEEANAAFAALRANPEAWHEEQAERELWEQTITDEIEEP